jgi:hypothetical protein
MESFAYLSVLLIPFFIGMGVLVFLGWQIYKDRKAEGARTRISHFVFGALFWLAFVAYFVWRSQAE